MDKMLRGLIVALFGIATTLLTVTGLVYVELRYDFAIYGFVYALVFPLGAIFSGLIASSGYYVGSKLLSYRPARGMLACVLAVSSATFFLINWLEYEWMKVDGQYVRSWMTFPSYLKFVLTHTAVTIGPGQSPSDTYELGIGGYLYAALLILGFSCGGYFIYLLVRSFPYCDTCGLYMKKQGSQTRYFVRAEDLAARGAAFKTEMERGQFRRAMEVHGGSGTREMDASSGYSLRAEIRHCKACGKQWVSLIAKQRVNKSWNVMTGIRYSTYCTERLDALEQLAGAG